MQKSTEKQIQEEPELLLTHHASQRMSQRGLSMQAIATTLKYGRLANVRDAHIYAIGRREVKHQGEIDLRPYEGIQVVCTPDGSVLTAYRSHNFSNLRHDGQRDRGRRRRAW